MPRIQNTRRCERRGVAAAEFAVCLPVLVLLMLGIIETSSMIFLKQSLAVAAYEGSHVAVAPEATQSDVISTCQDILADRRVTGATIQVTPSNIGALDPGQFFEVRVSAPTDPNAILPLTYFRGMTLESAASLMKEI